MTTTPASAANERDLLPCPFCGGAAKVGPTRSMYMAECDNAECSANPEVLTTFKHEAIAAWNRRVIPQPAAEPVDLWSLIDAYADHRAEYQHSTARHLAKTQRENVEDAKSELSIALARLVAPGRAPGTDSAAEPTAYMTRDKRMLIFADFFKGNADSSPVGMTPLFTGAPDALDAERLDYIKRKHVMGASYGGITSLNIIVHGDDYAMGGALYAIDCQIEREAGMGPAIAAMQPKGDAL